jgi:hypothetical protein
VAAIDEARSRGARRVQLHVRDDNGPALALYRGLGFRRLFGTTTLRLRAAGAARRLGVPARGCRVREWGRSGDGPARRLMAREGRPGRDPLRGPVAEALAGGTFLTRLEDWLRGRRRLAWAAEEAGAFRGVLVACGEGRRGPFRLEIITEEAWRGRVEAPLIEAAMIRLARCDARPVEATVRDVESGARRQPEEAGFETVRTLDRLELELVREQVQASA